MSNVMLKKIVFGIISFIFGVNVSLYGQIGNSNGQYDDVIKQAYEMINQLSIGDKKGLKTRFIESNFQTKKDFNKMLLNKNIKWTKEMIKTYGLPLKKDIIISGWKTVSKGQETIKSTLNLTFFFRDSSAKKSNSDDHLNLNFIKIENGTYIFNGLLLFKKSDFTPVKIKKLEN